MKQRAIIYTRRSAGSEVSTSHAKQRALCEEFAKSRGWPVAGYHEDRDISGTKDKRPGLDGMLLGLKPGDVVITSHIDRLARSTRSFAKILGRIEAAGAGYASVTQEFDSTKAAGRFMRDLLVSLGELEAAQAGERIKATHEHIVASGRGLPTSRRPYGWRYVKESKSWRIVPDEAKTVRRIVKDFLAGQTTNAIAYALNRAGIAGPLGGRWQAGTVRSLLANPRIAGYLTFRGQIQNAAPVMKGIISEAQWREVRSRLGDTKTRTRSNGSLLGGIARCERCGGGLYSNGEGQRATYRCGQYKNHGTCRGVQISRAWLDDYIRQTVELPGNIIHEAGEDDSGLADLEARLARLQDDHYVAGTLSREDFLRLSKSLNEKIDTLRRQARPRLLIDFAAGDWDRLSIGEARQRLAIVVEKIIVKPARRRGEQPSPARVEVVRVPIDEDE